MFAVHALVSLTLVRVGWTQVVNTANGRVQGTSTTQSGTTVRIFRGIPYARPPVGPFRFQKPEPVDDWRPVTLPTTAFKPACIQPTQLPPVTEPYRQQPTAFDEDCLYLNIWAPNSGSSRTVFVMFHGGGYYMGSATIGLFDGKYIAATRNVIVVTVNFRLGPLGFAYLGTGTVPGNMGLWDQQMALTWIKTNIQAFGGNPNLITLVGQDTGAASVGFHLLAPSSHDLFNRGVLQSGSPISCWVYNNAETARRNTMRLGGLAGCPVDNDLDLLECLNNADATSLADSQFQIYNKGLPFAPVVDGYFLPYDPVLMMQDAVFKNTSIIVGVNEDEATIIFLPWLLEVLEVTSPPPSVSLTQLQFKKLLEDFQATLRAPLNASLLTTFYVTSEPPDYLSALTDIWSDIDYKCPVVEFAHYYAKHNPVYQYSFRHRISKTPYPNWMGVPNSYEQELFLGLVFDNANGFTNQEKALSRTIHKFLANFGKSGSPNGPESVPVSWPAYELTKRKHLILKRSLSLGDSLRELQCTVVTKILPYFSVSHGAASEVILSTQSVVFMVLASLLWKAF